MDGDQIGPPPHVAMRIRDFEHSSTNLRTGALRAAGKFFRWQGDVRLPQLRQAAKSPTSTGGKKVESGFLCLTVAQSSSFQRCARERGKKGEDRGGKATGLSLSHSHLLFFLSFPQCFGEGREVVIGPVLFFCCLIHRRRFVLSECDHREK